MIRLVVGWAQSPGLRLQSELGFDHGRRELRIPKVREDNYFLPPRRAGIQAAQRASPVAGGPAGLREARVHGKGGRSDQIPGLRRDFQACAAIAQGSRVSRIFGNLDVGPQPGTNPRAAGWRVWPSPHNPPEEGQGVAAGYFADILVGVAPSDQAADDVLAVGG